jgi:dephospho-CoA kinase
MVPLKIGLTGGIGSGKTTICKVFEQLDIPVYSADDNAKFLMATDKKMITAIKNTFGNQIYNQQGELDRNALSAVVFNNAEALSKLNAIVHPRVKEYFLEWTSLQNTSYIIKEAAIMFESGAYKDLDYIINVSAPEELRIKRAMKRDNVSEDIIKVRINKQITEVERTFRSQYVIINDDTQLVLPQILKLHQLFNNFSSDVNANR